MTGGERERESMTVRKTPKVKAVNIKTYTTEDILLTSGVAVSSLS